MNASETARVGSPSSTSGRKRKAEDISGGAKQNTSKRLQGELRQLMMNGDADATAFPKNDDLFDWVATITGSAGTVYEGLIYKLSVKFPRDYPFSAPRIIFRTPCFHPNVDQHGNICLDILKDKWSAAYTVRTILLSLRSLLGEPNNDSPLNEHAAVLWRDQEGRSWFVF